MWSSGQTGRFVVFPDTFERMTAGVRAPPCRTIRRMTIDGVPSTSRAEDDGEMWIPNFRFLIFCRVLFFWVVVGRFGWW